MLNMVTDGLPLQGFYLVEQIMLSRIIGTLRLSVERVVALVVVFVVVLLRLLEVLMVVTRVEIVLVSLLFRWKMIR